MIWARFRTVNVRVTGGAGRWLSSPGWEAVMLAGPVPVRRSVVPSKVMGPVRVKVSERVELTRTGSRNGASP